MTYEEMLTVLTTAHQDSGLTFFSKQEDFTVLVFVENDELTVKFRMFEDAFSPAMLKKFEAHRANPEATLMTYTNWEILEKGEE